MSLYTCTLYVRVLSSSVNGAISLVQNFPEDIVLHCQSREVAEAHFKSRLKEVRKFKCTCKGILVPNVWHYLNISAHILFTTWRDHHPTEIVLCLELWWFTHTFVFNTTNWCIVYVHHIHMQADCVKHKSEVIQSLTPQEFGQIWKGFSESKCLKWCVYTTFFLPFLVLKIAFTGWCVHFPFR